MFVVGGLIVGNPDDTRESIEANLDFARRYVDWPYIQHPTPYPRTPMAQQFRDEGLVVDDDVSHYDGTTAVVRSRHLAASEIEFLRWRAERWMKLRHLPAALFHSPLFSIRHGLKMMIHTFAGTNLRSMLGLDEPQSVFERYRETRRRERNAVALAGETVSYAAAVPKADDPYWDCAMGRMAGEARPVSSIRQEGPPT